MERKENEGGGVDLIELLEEIEIEEYGKKGHRPPRAKRYIIRIDKIKYTVHVHEMTGRQVLGVGRQVQPPDQYSISHEAARWACEADRPG